MERKLHGDFNRPRGNELTFVGAEGAMWFKTLRTGYWWILKGSKAYAGIRGHGHETRRYVHGGPRVDITMRGTVSR